MKKPRSIATGPELDLRRRAEAIVAPEATATDAETRKLLHELRVHQIELELQNAELREARAEAETNLSRYTDLYDFAPVGYFTLERDSTIRQTNVAGARLLGISRSQLVRQHFGAFVTGDSLPVFNDFMGRMFADCTPMNVEIALSLPDRDRQLIAQINAVVAAGGQTCDMAVLDVTALKEASSIQAERATRLSQQGMRLREGDRRKNEFLAMLGHELRNPIAPIVLAAEILERQGSKDTALLQSAIGMIKRQCRHLVRLVDELLDVARVTQGKITLSKAPVDLRDVMNNGLEMVRPRIDEHQHELSFSLPSKPVRVDADSVRLAQVLGNLLDNAVKYTPDGGRIGFSLEREGAQAVIRVKDTGIGMAKSLLPRVFELFTQAEPSGDRVQSGLGVGLALAKRLVELHGGSLEVSSAGVGQGSEFVVRLPLPAGAEQPIHPVGWGSRHVPAPVRRVLVVDDQADIVTATALLLETMGHDVQRAQSGREALACVRTRPFDVVLLDIGMPELSGYEVARRLRQTPGLEHLKLIAMTGYGLDSDREECVRAGFDWHLVKPVDPSALAAILAGLDRTETEHTAGACDGKKSDAGADSDQKSDTRQTRQRPSIARPLRSQTDPTD